MSSTKIDHRPENTVFMRLAWPLPATLGRGQTYRGIYMEGIFRHKRVEQTPNSIHRGRRQSPHPPKRAPLVNHLKKRRPARDRKRMVIPWWRLLAHPRHPAFVRLLRGHRNLPPRPLCRLRPNQKPGGHYRPIILPQILRCR